jgi:N-acetylglucosamine-6-phosphate deacetylase
VVAYQPTLVSSPPEAYDAALAATAAAMAAPDGGARVLGVHLEGPFLSREWPGAHDPANLLEPDPELADRLCEAGPVTMVTLAPELDGGLELVERLAGRGVIVSVGHSNADAATAHAAFDRGASAITHVHNAHRRWRPRDPGPAGVALVRPDVWVQAIVDGVHLAPESALGAFLAAGARFCLVTDAVEAAGMPPGSYRLGDREVHVDDGAVRLADGTLAGSVLTMDAAVRNLVASGAALADAVHAASTAPARLLGRDDLGVLRPGVAANVAVLNDELEVERTVVGGQEAFATR